MSIRVVKKIENRSFDQMHNKVTEIIKTVIKQFGKTQDKNSGE